MRSSKFSTPRLSRVTPISRSSGELRIAERARLALEGDFRGLAPVCPGFESGDQPLQLLRGQERRRPAAEIDEVQWPAGDGRRLQVPFPLRNRQGRDIPRPGVRSCRCRPGNNRNGSASGRRECGRRGRAARRAAAPAGRPSRRPRRSGSRRKTAGSWRRNSCRRPLLRGPADAKLRAYSA